MNKGKGEKSPFLAIEGKMTQDAAKYWTAADKGELKFGGQTLRGYIIQGPRNEVFTVLVLNEDRRLVDKLLAALAKAEV